MAHGSISTDMQKAIEDLNDVMRFVDELYPDVKQAAEEKLSKSRKYQYLCRQTVKKN